MSKLISSGIFSLVNRISTLLLGLINFLFLVRILSKEDFGAWVLLLSIGTTLELLRNGLIQNAFINFYAQGDNEYKRTLLSSSLLLNAVFTVFLSFGLYLSSDALSAFFSAPPLASLLRTYAFILLLLVPFSQLSFLQQANSRFFQIMLGGVSRNLALTLYIVYITFFEKPLSLDNLLQFMIYGISIGTIIYIVLSLKLLRFSLRIDFTCIKDLLNFGKYVFGTNLASFAFKTTDQIMIGGMLGPGSVAIYNVAVRFSNLIEYPTTSVAEVMFPVSSERLKSRDKTVAKSIYEKLAGVNLAIVLPLVTITFILSDLLVELFAGAGYEESSNILRITILFGIISPFNRHFGTVLDSFGKPKLNFSVISIMLLINLVVNFAFINVYGVIGAAYGTFCSYFIGFVISQTILRQQFNVSIPGVLRHTTIAYSSAFRFLKRKLNSR